MSKLRSIKFEVTEQCPLQCVHCSTNAGNTKHVNVSWENAQKILNDSVLMGVEEISFSGGEPLLWPYLKDAVETAYNGGIYTSVYTTGISPNTGTTLNSLLHAGLNKAIFSVYSDNYQNHDEVTCKNGSFEKTINAIKLATSIGLKTGIHFVPTKINFQELSHVVELGNSLGVEEVSVLRLVPQGRGEQNKHLLLEKDETIKLKNEIEQLLKDGNNVRIGSPYNILKINGNPKCTAGIDRLTISPDLSIYPCDAFKQASAKSVIGEDDPFANLATQRLVDCWEHSKYLNAVREYLLSPTSKSKQCLTCVDYSHCLSGCAAQKFYRSNKLANLPDPLCLS